MYGVAAVRLLAFSTQETGKKTKSGLDCFLHPGLQLLLFV